MMKLNAIQFAAGLSVDLSDEIDELRDMVYECGKDSSKIDEAVNTYKHLHSFLQGIEYILDYFEESEEREQLKELHAKHWSSDLQELWAPLMMLKWTRDLNENVTVRTCYAVDRTVTYEVTVGNRDTETFQRTYQVLDYLRGLEK